MDFNIDYSLFGFSSLREMYNVHPAFVHGPIALLPAALTFYFLGTLFRSWALTVAGRACLYLAALGGIAAVWTGYLAAQDTFPHNDRIHHLMATHGAVGFLLLGLTAFLVLWSFWHEDQRPKSFWFFLLLLAGAAYLAAQNADIGSRMVYLEGAAVKPMAPLMHDDDAQQNPQPGQEAPAEAAPSEQPQPTEEPAPVPEPAHHHHHHHHS